MDHSLVFRLYRLYPTYRTCFKVFQPLTLILLRIDTFEENLQCLTRDRAEETVRKPECNVNTTTGNANILVHRQCIAQRPSRGDTLHMPLYTSTPTGNANVLVHSQCIAQSGHILLGLLRAFVQFLGTTLLFCYHRSMLFDQIVHVRIPGKQHKQSTVPYKL